MQSRLYPFAVMIAAVTTIALTALPWISLSPSGIDMSWNGLGMTDSDLGIDMGVSTHGWWVVAACVIAILAALIALMPTPKAAPLRSPAFAVASLACALASLVPIMALISPKTFYGDLLKNLGATGVADMFPLNNGVIVATTVAVLITAVVSAIAVVAYRERPAVRGGSATKP